MISAKEAIEITKLNREKAVQKQLLDLENSIKEAIMSGKSYIRYDGSLYIDVKIELEKLGYRLESGTQYNDSFYVIRWN